ncbi:MAG: hypothetical protein RBS99_14570 [Rhodospirillales bacterium]|jgi:hypothetical protein|nr:hypothetical protein [Rhodospirillales bacterium]
MLTTEQIQAFAATLPANLSNGAKRRMAYMHFWPEPMVREAEQDARGGDGAKLAAYDADCAAIKAAISDA